MGRSLVWCRYLGTLINFFSSSELYFFTLQVKNLTAIRRSGRVRFARYRREATSLWITSCFWPGSTAMSSRTFNSQSPSRVSALSYLCRSADLFNSSLMNCSIDILHLPVDWKCKVIPRNEWSCPHTVTWYCTSTPRHYEWLWSRLVSRWYHHVMYIEIDWGLHSFCSLVKYSIADKSRSK